MKDKQWLKEPDLVEFVYNGYDALIVRHPDFGHLCGYVVIPQDHPLYGNNNYMQDMNHLDVHGGITYGQFQYLTELKDNNKYKDKYLIGFDCAHTWDIQPYYDKRQVIKDIQKEYVHELNDLINKFESTLGIKKDALYEKETYKNIEFVTAELKRLIDQLIQENNER